MIETLIDKFDSFEIVRDKVALILATEQLEQQQLAIAAAKDPQLWKLRVFIERTNPWEVLRDPADDRTPLVNVWFDIANIDLSASQTINKQQYDGTVNIDIIGFGRTEVLVAGQDSGDEVAAKEAQRAARLVRNIIMSPIYRILELRGLVGDRWVGTLQSYQPDSGAVNARQMAAVRLTLNVKYIEQTTENTFDQLCELGVVVTNENQEVLLEAEYEYPL